GISALTMTTSANSIIQLTVSPQMRGRVSALYVMILMGGTPFGAPFIGWVGETFGARWTLILGGLITLVGTLIGLVLFTSTQGVVVRPRFGRRLGLSVTRTPLRHGASRPRDGAGERRDGAGEPAGDESPAPL